MRKQQASGATYLDVNAGARIGHESGDMKWLLETIQPVVDIPMCLDSPDPAVLEMAYGMVTKPPMINSISLESERYETMLPFLTGKDVSVIALCMDDTGLPQRKIVNRAFLSLLMGVGLDGAIIDPLDNAIMAVVKTTEMLLGNDEFCMHYLDSVRAGQIVA
ncbi:MAG: dihydropteroate synthase [Thermoleophilia bacterium]